MKIIKGVIMKLVMKHLKNSNIEKRKSMKVMKFVIKLVMQHLKNSQI